MTTPSRPTIVPALLPEPWDRRPTVIQPNGGRNAIFTGWGPKL